MNSLVDPECALLQELNPQPLHIWTRSNQLSYPDRVFCPFLIGLFVFSLFCFKSSLKILDTHHSLGKLQKILSYSYSVTCLFIQLTLHTQEFFILMK